MVFGGGGTWEGITTSAAGINGEIRIVALAYSTGFDVDATTLRRQLYRMPTPPE